MRRAITRPCRFRLRSEHRRRSRRPGRAARAPLPMREKIPMRVSVSLPNLCWNARPGATPAPRQLQFLEAHRLHQIIAGAVAHGFDASGRAISGQQNHRRARRRSLHLAHQLEAVPRCRHAHVVMTSECCPARMLSSASVPVRHVRQPAAALEARLQGGAHPASSSAMSSRSLPASPQLGMVHDISRREFRRALGRRPIARQAAAGTWLHDRDGSRRDRSPVAVRESAADAPARVRCCRAAC